MQNLTCIINHIKEKNIYIYSFIIYIYNYSGQTCNIYLNIYIVFTYVLQVVLNNSFQMCHN